MRVRRHASAPLVDRLDALDRASVALREVAPEADIAHAREVLDRIDRRRALTADHTVVGVFGATGSGKSSLVNALVGAEISRAAVRRPTTARPVAAILGESGSEPLLDWLEVEQRYVLDGRGGPLLEAATARSGLFSGPQEAPGLVILDLPDFDSVEEANRTIAQRMTGYVDVLLWVTDPQKYADDILHHDFITPFAGHDAVTIVLLNQIDRLREQEREPVLASLARLARRDGLEAAPVLGVSAATGEGLDELRTLLIETARGRQASVERQKADVEGVAARLREAADPAGMAGDVPVAARSALVEDLSAAARIEPVARAVGASYRYRAGGQTGWPLLRWLRRFRVDPLKRLNIGQERSAPGLDRTSLPAPDAGTRARASRGVREFADAASRGGSDPWRAEVRRAARSREDELPDQLDQAVAGADLRARAASWWWPVINVLQWLAVLTWVVGLGWLALNTALVAAGVPPLPVPMIEDLWVPIPLPVALIVLGVAVGVLLAALAAGVNSLAAAWHARRARRVLRGRVGDAGELLVVRPVEDVLDRAADAATDLAVAAGERPVRRV